MKIDVITDSVLNFAIRVSDGAGTLSSKHANVSSACSGQMYSKGSGVPAGTYEFEVALSKPLVGAADDVVVTMPAPAAAIDAARRISGA